MPAATGYRPRSLLLQWHLTERCNLRCAHCYQDGSAAAEGGLADWLAILNQFLAFAAQCPAGGQITLTGGEPLLHPDFPRLMARLSAQAGAPWVAVLTNGTLIDEATARQLCAWRLRYVQVSIDGDKTTHDAIRGGGAFDRTVAGLEHLVRAGVTTLVSFTAQRGNFREFPAVARLGRELGVDRVWADRMLPLGSGAAMDGGPLTPEETREFVGLLRAARAARAGRGVRALLGRARRTEIAAHRALQFLGTGSLPYHCSAGDTLLAVMPNGDVYPCRRMPIQVGNLFEAPLAQLYACDRLAALRDRSRVSIGCENCIYAHLCGGGLRCLAYATTGDPYRADPGCWLANSATSARHS